MSTRPNEETVLPPVRKEAPPGRACKRGGRRRPAKRAVDARARCQRSPIIIRRRAEPNRRDTRLQPAAICRVATPSGGRRKAAVSTVQGEDVGLCGTRGLRSPQVFYDQTRRCLRSRRAFSAGHRLGTAAKRLALLRCGLCLVMSLN